MRILGVFTTIVVAAVLAGGVAVGVTSIPDVRRYLRMRAM